MKESQNEINYARIAEAIRFIRDNRKEQPGLEAIAEAVNMSPFHFQRIFKEWQELHRNTFFNILMLNMPNASCNRHTHRFSTRLRKWDCPAQDDCTIYLSLSRE